MFNDSLSAFALAAVLALLITYVLMRMRPSKSRSRSSTRNDALDTVADWPPEAARVMTTPERKAYEITRRALPQPGLRLEGTVNCPEPKAFPALVLYPTGEDLECLLARPVIGGLLLLDPDAPGGFVREWTDFGFPPTRHYGYAAQWFALALAAVAIFVGVNRRRPA